MIVTSQVSITSNSPHREGREGKLFTDVLVCQLMSQAHTLRLVLNRLSIYNGTFEILHNCAMNGVTLKHGRVSMLLRVQRAIAHHDLVS